MLTRSIYTIILILLYTVSFSQTNISGTINDYQQVTMIGSKMVIVNSTLPFSEGNKVLLIQMQGATIDETNSSTYGTISNYNGAGNYEFHTICSINGDTIFLGNNIVGNFDPLRSVQLIRVPQYTNATISGGNLTALPWNGSIGGVIVMEINGTLDFGTQNIDVSALGFRGGDAILSGGFCSGIIFDGSYYTSLTNPDAKGLKGEGIAQLIVGKECSRGPQANGGGGGNNHNAGGSGGANYGTGGEGGRREKSSTFTCGSLGGIQSRNLVTGYSANKIFLGGGGGAGHGNNVGIIGESGLNGGGIVIIKADTVSGNGQSIIANGDAWSTNATNEGGGGAGAGGSVLLDVSNYSSVLNVSAAGGQGTNVANTGTSNCNGPGGGGGGGIVWINNSTTPGNLTVVTNGGVAGTITSTSQSSCTLGSNNGATDGLAGITLTNLILNDFSMSSSDTISPASCNNYTSPSGKTWTTSGTYTDTITSINGCDSIITIHLTINNNVTGTDTRSECGSLTWIDGITYTSSNSTATFNIVNGAANTCDSLVTLDLTITSIDTVVMVTKDTLTSNQNGATYQWVDCNNGNTPITGDTNQTFIATTNGDYAVVITEKGCTDTSACVNVTITGLNENTFSNAFNIYPNPTKDQFTISFNQTIDDSYIISIRNTLGQVVKEFKPTTQVVNVGLSKFNNGVYFVNITNNEESKTVKVLKE